MKNRILVLLFFCLACGNIFAWSDSTVTVKDLKNLAGCWNGSLTYLDYSSGKPFTMPANIAVQDHKNRNQVICAITYPKEPAANGPDTIFISADGRYINDGVIKVKRLINKDSLEIITEEAGIDGNDNKAAIIRHTYSLSRSNYSVKKEVQFPDQEKWILRNVYTFTRVKTCP